MVSKEDYESVKSILSGLGIESMSASEKKDAVKEVANEFNFAEGNGGCSANPEPGSQEVLCYGTGDNSNYLCLIYVDDSFGQTIKLCYDGPEGFDEQQFY